jgi:uncharacterized paraquat-inducible protein A
MNVRYIIEGALADQLSRIMKDIDAFKAQERRASPLSPRRRLISLLPKRSRCCGSCVYFSEAVENSECGSCHVNGRDVARTWSCPRFLERS